MGRSVRRLIVPVEHPAVEVIDGLLQPDLEAKLIEAVSWMPVYFLNRRDRFKTHDLDIHWYYPIAVTEELFEVDVEPDLDALDEALSPIRDVWQKIKNRHREGVRLYECMLSANSFGTEGHVHNDISDPNKRPNHHTALVFCNRKWDPAWAGETVVFDARGEISQAVLPRPGRVVKLRGDPLHVGRGVSRTCPSDRRVLVFKYWSV